MLEVMLTALNSDAISNSDAIMAMVVDTAGFVPVRNPQPAVYPATSSWACHHQVAGVKCRVEGEPCTSKQWRCRSGKCIDLTYVCDRVDDCGDFSDEEDALCKVGTVLYTFVAGYSDRTGDKGLVKN